MDNKKIIFSGVQPSGNLHLGNYLGAIKNWVELQDKYKCLFCVVDYHAITVKQDPKELKKKVIEIAKIYLASGIDPKKSIIFQQSQISEHTELTWILNCVSVKTGDLRKMRQFNSKADINSIEDINNKMLSNFKNFAEKEVSELKDEVDFSISSFLKQVEEVKNSDKDISDKEIKRFTFNIIESTKNHTMSYNQKAYRKISDMNEEEILKMNKVSVGLFDYPVLMASDILLYQTDLVPVGEDQKQHIELTRTIAKRFNNEYTNVFKIPEAVIKKEGARIMGLDDANKKMSKSASSEANYIGLLDDPEKARKKIMKAVTDSEALVKYDEEKKPAVSNLLTIYSLLSDHSVKDLEDMYKGKGYGDFKKDLAEIVVKFLVDFQNKYNNITDEEVKKILERGFKELKPIANKTLNNVKEKLGII